MYLQLIQTFAILEIYTFQFEISLAESIFSWSKLKGVIG